MIILNACAQFVETAMMSELNMWFLEGRAPRSLWMVSISENDESAQVNGLRPKGVRRFGVESLVT